MGNKYYGTVWQRLPDADEVEPFMAIHSDDVSTLAEAQAWVEKQIKDNSYIDSGEVFWNPSWMVTRQWHYESGKWSEVSYA